ncbi:hypothetical protein Tco_0560788 [Tanacetum coccineum]
MEDVNPIRTLGDYSKPSHEGYQITIELSAGNNVVPLRSDTIRLLAIGLNFFQQDPSPPGGILLLVSLLNSFHWKGLQNSKMTSSCSNNIKENLFLKYGLVSRTYSKKSPIMSAGGKLRDKNAEESWALLEDLSLYDNESCNDPKDFAKPVKTISLPQNVSSKSDRRLIELKNQVQRLMEAYLAPKSSVQVNKNTSSCEICSGPHDTQYCTKNPEQAFVDYASSRIDEAGDARLFKFKADFKQQQGEMTNKIDTVLKAINDRITGALSSDMAKNPKLNVNSTSLVSSARSYLMKDPNAHPTP